MSSSSRRGSGQGLLSATVSSLGEERSPKKLTRVSHTSGSPQRRALSPHGRPPMLHSHHMSPATSFRGGGIASGQPPASSVALKEVRAAFLQATEGLSGPLAPNPALNPNASISEEASKELDKLSVDDLRSLTKNLLAIGNLAMRPCFEDDHLQSSTLHPVMSGSYLGGVSISDFAATGHLESGVMPSASGFASEASAAAFSVLSAARPLPQYTHQLTKSIDPESGQKMINDRYLMLDNLGSGSQGKVKLALDVNENEYRAVKIIRRPKSVFAGAGRNLADRKRSERLKKEIAVLKKMRHSNVVRLHEVIDDPNAQKLYLVLQYADKGTLVSMDGMRCETMSVEAFTPMARQICAGLAYIHSHGVVHRDIKPENILRGSDGQVFLADFGVAEVFGFEDDGADVEWKRTKNPARRRVQIEGTTGTPAFLPPEVLNAVTNASNATEDPAVDGYAADVWALGITFFVILTGMFPNVANTEDDGDEEGSTGSPVNGLQQSLRLAKSIHCCAEESENLFANAVGGLEPSNDGTAARQWRELIADMLSPDPHDRPDINLVRRRVKAIDELLNFGLDSMDLTDTTTHLDPSASCEAPARLDTTQPPEPKLRDKLRSNAASSPEEYSRSKQPQSGSANAASQGQGTSRTLSRNLSSVDSSVLQRITDVEMSNALTIGNLRQLEEALGTPSRHDVAMRVAEAHFSASGHVSAVPSIALAPSGAVSDATIPEIQLSASSASLIHQNSASLSDILVSKSRQAGGITVEAATQTEFLFPTLVPTRAPSTADPGSPRVLLESGSSAFPHRASRADTELFVDE